MGRGGAKGKALPVNLDQPTGLAYRSAASAFTKASVILQSRQHDFIERMLWLMSSQQPPSNLNENVRGIDDRTVSLASLLRRRAFVFSVANRCKRNSGIVPDGLVD
jgi:hypothetical protein